MEIQEIYSGTFVPNLQIELIKIGEFGKAVINNITTMLDDRTYNVFDLRSLTVMVSI